MPRTTPYCGCPLEQEIIAKIGANKTSEKVFNDELYDGDNLLMSFYTYRHQVCVLDGEGMDVNFSSYSDETKKLIHDNIMNNNFK